MRSCNDGDKRSGNGSDNADDSLAEATSGTCGISAKWTFTSQDGKLTISGEGTVNFSEDTQSMLPNDKDKAPWLSLAKSITSVEIAAGITDIPPNAFNECKKIEKYTVASGNSKFCSVNGVLMDSEKSILYRYPANAPASIYTVNLKKSNGTTGTKDTAYIAPYAFKDSQNLETVVLAVTNNNYVTNIDAASFTNTSVKQLYILNNGSSMPMIIDDSISKDITIYGYKNSAAQTYAGKHGNKFVLITNAITIPTESAIQPTPAAIMGDIDGSGSVDIMDVIKVNKATLGVEKLTDEQQELADINKDGKVDSADALLLLKIALDMPIE